MKRLSLLLITLLAAGTCLSQAPAALSSSDILLGLKKLNRVGSVLYIAAHPDDENTRLLSYLSNELCVRTAYLSMTRGDGGQNLVGTEQGALLGLLRTQELLAARRIDGAEQYFTRAVDFGYSKSPDETFAWWDRDSVLSDVVWVIRTFRPDVIITRFDTDGSGGHGHHTASALLASAAFDAAADPARFPEQLAYTSVWQARRLLYNSTARFSNPAADMSGLLSLDIGVYNPLLGKSYGELAAESRSMHKSQGFGAARVRGPQQEYFRPVKGDPAIASVFEGLGFTWDSVPEAASVGRLLDAIIAAYDPSRPAASVPSLLQVYDLLGTVRDEALRDSKREATVALLLACAGFFSEAVADAPATAPGDTARIKITLLNRSDAAITVNRVFIPGLLDTTLHAALPDNQPVITEQQVHVPASAAVSNPYWLELPHPPGRFRLPSPSMTGKAQSDPAFSVTVELLIGGRLLRITRPVQYKWIEPSDGERYRPYIVAPAATVNFADDVVVFPTREEKSVSLRVHAFRDSVSGFLRLRLPAGWAVQPEKAAVQIGRKGQEQQVTFRVMPPEGTAVATATAELIDGPQRWNRSLTEVKHDYVPVQTLFSEASARCMVPGLKRTATRIGYIEGAGDEVPQCLRQIGYTVTVLDDKALQEGDLSRFDAIVVGIRAYNTNDRLALYKPKLMNFVRNGGNLVVQYNTNSFLGPLNADIGPYPFKITRDRVTHEEAPVTFALPAHTLLQSPNHITEKDFDGWIQERGIYFAGSWDSAYAAPFSMHDPGEQPMTGSTLVAQAGKGYFIYTGLSFFRELPAGVPGAYRLFVNMIECGR